MLVVKPKNFSILIDSYSLNILTYSCPHLKDLNTKKMQKTFLKDV